MESKDRLILYNEEVAPGYFRLGLEWKGAEARPGQFVMVRVSDGLDPLLRRPFGVYGVAGGRGKDPLRGNSLELLYKVVGRGTKILSAREKNECVNVLGPVGNGFPEPKENETVIMVAGGMGLVPFLMLSRKLGGGLLLYGARGKREAGLIKDFKDAGCKVKVSTIDGSVGVKGLVTVLLEKEISEGSVVYACGPVGMLKAASRVAAERGVKCHVSLERSMACGIGVCLGCAVKVRAHREHENKNYAMVCSDGPVFDSEDIDWDAL